MKEIFYLRPFKLVTISYYVKPFVFKENNFTCKKLAKIYKSKIKEKINY